jgi:hypothetical protein
MMEKHACLLSANGWPCRCLFRFLIPEAAP